MGVLVCAQARSVSMKGASHFPSQCYFQESLKSASGTTITNATSGSRWKCAIKPGDGFSDIRDTSTLNGVRWVQAEFPAIFCPVALSSANRRKDVALLN